MVGFCWFGFAFCGVMLTWGVGFWCDLGVGLVLAV